MKEFNKLDKVAIPGKPIVGYVDPNNLTNKDKNKSFKAVKLIKEKRDVKIKLIKCANGSNKWKYLK